MSAKLLKKLKIQEEKLLDAIYEFQEFCDATEDAELSSKGSEFCELIVDFIHDNDTVTLNDIKTYIEEEME